MSARYAAACVLVVASAARADTLALGVQLGNPGTGSGLALAGTQMQFGLLARYDRPRWPVLSAGLGTPVAGVGISGWRRAARPRRRARGADRDARAAHRPRLPGLLQLGVRITVW